jgi:hypothetical protein
MPRLSNEAHETFAQHFVQWRHFGKAAEAAGSTAENLSSAGISLYERPDVYARVQELTEQKLKPLKMDSARLMTEIGRMSTVDYASFYHPDGSQKAPHELTPAQSACVRGTDRSGRYQFWDKIAPVTILAKHFKIIGEEGDGVNALASALANRLDSARRRIEPGEPEPVRVVDSSEPEPQPEEEQLW